MTRLFFVAHASTAALEQVRFPSDETVSERGRRELARTTAPVVDRLVSAPERRTVETTRALGSPAGVEPALRDLDYGRWAGRSMDDVPECDLAEWLTDPASAPHGGESIDRLVARIGTWLATVGDGPERVGVVTHPAVVRAVTLCVLGAPPAAFWRIDVRPLSVIRIHGRPGRWTLRITR